MNSKLNGKNNYDKIPDDLLNVSFSGQVDAVEQAPAAKPAYEPKKDSTFTPVQIKFNHANHNHMAALKYYKSLGKGKAAMVLEGIGFMMAVKRTPSPDIDYILDTYPAIQQEVMLRDAIETQKQIDELKQLNELLMQRVIALSKRLNEQEVRVAGNASKAARNWNGIVSNGQMIKSSIPIMSIDVGQTKPLLNAGKDES